MEKIPVSTKCKSFSCKSRPALNFSLFDFRFSILSSGCNASSESFFVLQVLYTETLSNPTLRVTDISALAEVAHARGCQLVTDNTFTPLIITPSQWGSDVVIHSLTKFVSGASDVMAGVACGTHAFVAKLVDLHTGMQAHLSTLSSEGLYIYWLTLLVCRPPNLPG